MPPVAAYLLRACAGERRHTTATRFRAINTPVRAGCFMPFHDDRHGTHVYAGRQ